MDSHWADPLKRVLVFVEKKAAFVILGSMLILGFSAVSTGFIYKLPVIGEQLLANKLQSQADAVNTSELNKVRLKALGEALENGQSEYSYEVPTFLGPK